VLDEPASRHARDRKSLILLDEAIDLIHRGQEGLWVEPGMMEIVDLSLTVPLEVGESFVAGERPFIRGNTTTRQT
jgi:hypothetical protein